MPPFPGRFTQIFSSVNTLPALMGLMEHIVANAKSMVTCSSATGALLPPRCCYKIIAPSINSLQVCTSILQIISGPGRSILSVKWRSRMEAPNATAPKQA